MNKVIIEGDDANAFENLIVMDATIDQFVENGGIAKIMEQISESIGILVS